MKRTIIILCALLAACDVGDVTSGNNPGTDGGAMQGDGGGGGGGDGATANCTNGNAQPSAAHPHSAPVNANDPYNMGQNCMAQGCHTGATPAGGLAMYAAGTVYTDANGTKGAAGAYVKLGTMHTYADDHGNFYFSSQPSFPVAANETLVDATCPTQSKMVEGVATGQCTGGSCHTPAGGPAATGGYVHL